MIDPHVHCRDWMQSHKETIAHALKVAEGVGVSAIFDMPNTDPPVTTEELVRKRLSDAKKAKSAVFYGVYAGVTPDENQIKEVVRVQKELFPSVVGLKMYAGHSVGDLAVVKEEDQQKVYRILSEEDYKGVIAVHCEKEKCIKPNLWNPSVPVSHSLARPVEAEIESVKDQLRFASDAGFKGRLHIAHVSTPMSVELIEKARKEASFQVSCGLTPHHCMLNTDDVVGSDEPLLFKVNPPLRDKRHASKMIKCLRLGKIDVIETDHAPHTLREKINQPFMSGFPGLPFVPHFLNYLRASGFSESQLLDLTHNNVCKIFKMNLPFDGRAPHLNLEREYEVDIYREAREKCK